MKSSPAAKPRPRSGARDARKSSAKVVQRTNWTLLLGLLLVVATVAVYYPVHTHPFANFDDGPYVVSNPHVRAGLSLDTVKWAFTSIGSVTPDVPDWHPLAWLSHALDTEVFGFDPAGPHDENLFLHALNVLLLFWVLQQATGFTGRSAMVAGLFALHPINVESVAWISERKNLLSMLFFLLALAAYRWYARRPQVGRYLVVALLFALGLMAKPWPLQRLAFRPSLFAFRKNDLGEISGEKRTANSEERPSGEERRAKSEERFLWLVLEKLPLFALAAASAVITVKSQLAIGGIDVDKSVSFS
ncbi:MAG: hypothetical protein ABSE85_18935, partial [Candidatus Korobacteraceae bacterium]